MFSDTRNAQGMVPAAARMNPVSRARTMTGKRLQSELNGATRVLSRVLAATSPFMSSFLSFTSASLLPPQGVTVVARTLTCSYLRDIARAILV